MARDALGQQLNWRLYPGVSVPLLEPYRSMHATGPAPAARAAAEFDSDQD